MRIKPRSHNLEVIAEYNFCEMGGVLLEASQLKRLSVCHLQFACGMRTCTSSVGGGHHSVYVGGNDLANCQPPDVIVSDILVLPRCWVDREAEGHRLLLNCQLERNVRWMADVILIHPDVLVEHTASTIFVFKVLPRCWVDREAEGRRLLLNCLLARNVRWMADVILIHPDVTTAFVSKISSFWALADPAREGEQREQLRRSRKRLRMLTTPRWLILEGKLQQKKRNLKKQVERQRSFRSYEECHVADLSYINKPAAEEQHSAVFLLEQISYFRTISEFPVKKPGSTVSPLREKGIHQDALFSGHGKDTHSQRCPLRGLLLAKEQKSPESELGQMLSKLTENASTSSPLPPPPLPPLHFVLEPLRVTLEVDGMKFKGLINATVARQLTEHHLEQHYTGWSRVYTDGSVRPSDGSSTAAVILNDIPRCLGSPILVSTHPV
ncbi:uncharacterized protein ISCGN_016040 [Ixodes scapularis]